jgi:hypothetical protein
MVRRCNSFSKRKINRRSILRKLITSYSDKEEYPTYIVDFVENYYVDVTIYAKGENANNCTEKIHFEFVEMSKVLLIN